MTQGRQLGWTSAAALALAAIAAWLFPTWLAIEARQAAPLVDVRLLRRPTIALTNAAALCIGCGIFIAYVPLAPIAEAPASTGYGLGLSVSAAGALLIPHGVTQILVGPWAGSLCSRIGSRATLLIGATINTVTMAAIAVAHDSVAALLLGGGILGVGQACALTAMANSIVASVASDEVGIATGINTVMRTIGMAVGSALSAAILAAGGGVLPTDHAYVVAFAVAAVVTAGAVACAAALPGDRAPSAEPVPAR
jgi:predicted MFS family arabinose efflux permease